MNSRLVAFVIFIFFSIGFFAQDSLLVGKKYKEDQIYLGLSYNLLQKKPDIVFQKGISLGIETGFIKDISISSNGKFALGVGMGYAYNKLQTNINFTDKYTPFDIIVSDYRNNKIEYHSIEIPFEIRYRNSSATEFKFWRLYIGGKVSYIFSSKAVYKSEMEKEKTHNLIFLEKWHYGPKMSAGFSTWNVYVFYDISKLLKDNAIHIDYKPNELNVMQIGLQFYMF